MPGPKQKSLEATGSPQEHDPDWQRLQTIFRKHQEQEEMSLNHSEETASENKTESMGPSVEQAPHEKEKPKPVHQEQRLETIFRKHQELEKERSVSVPEAKTAESKLVEPPAPTSSEDNDPPEVKQEVRPRTSTIFRKEQKQAVGRLDPLPKGTASETESIQPIAMEARQNEGSKERALQSSGTIFRQPQEQTITRPADTPQVAKEGVTQLVVRGTAPEPESAKQTDQKAGGQAIQRKPQQEAEPVNAPEKNISQPESAQSNEPAADRQNEKPSFGQRVWHGLKSIFRKQHEPKEAIPTNPVESAKTGTARIEPDLRQPPSPVPTEVDVPASTGETGEHSELVQATATALRSKRPVQRSIEAIEVEAQPPETSLPEKSQGRSSIPTGRAPTADVEPVPSEPDARLEEAATEAREPSPAATDQIQEQPLPLQFAWDVQRVDDPDPPSEERMAPQDLGPDLGIESVIAEIPNQAGEEENIRERIGAGEQQLQTAGIENLPPTDQPSSEVSSTPVEILPPSRPRPVGASVRPTNSTVQRQPENKHLTGENKESSLVSTAVGPLPADLWSLLGQEPPTSRHEPEVRDKPSVTSGFSQPELAADQKILSSQHPSDTAEKSVQAVDVTAVLQRQAQPKDPATSPDHEKTQDSQTQETSQGEPDLDALAHQVYAEVRRRLATEWERTRRLV